MNAGPQRPLSALRWHGLHALLVLGLKLWAVPAAAELSGDDYLPSAKDIDGAQRARVRAEIAVERRREAERAEQAACERAAEQARRNAARNADAAGKPKGERLVEAHCRRCHAPEAIARVRHTRLGWYLGVLRMRTVNGARIPRQEARLIVEHLSKTQGAAPQRAAIEYGLALLTLGLLGAAGLYPTARRSRAKARARQPDAIDRDPGRAR